MRFNYSSLVPHPILLSRKVLALVGRNRPVNSPEELAEGQALVDRFMLGYRGIFPTVPPKLHFLEDHCVQQVLYRIIIKKTDNGNC